MGNNQYPPLPSIIREGGFPHFELVSEFCDMFKHEDQSDVQKMLKQVQHDVNNLAKRNYSHNKRRHLTIALSGKGRGKCPSSFTKKLAAFTLAEGATHVDNFNNIRRAAFTLAEVLITLGIIGVVAAMTMPGLVSKYRKYVVETELQKAFSIISQVVRMSEVQNGDAAYWLYPTIGSATSLEGAEQSENFVNLYIKPHIKYIKAEKDNIKVYYSDGTESYLTTYINKVPQFILADGIFLTFHPTATIDQSRGYVMLVYVGTTNMRKNSELVEGKNFFTFTVSLADTISKVSLEPQSYLNWSCQKLNENQETFIENCRKNTRETSGVSSSVYCTYMIYCNGWEIPDNYPIRI